MSSRAEGQTALFRSGGLHVAAHVPISNRDMARKDDLRRYHEKRDFTRTTEPSDGGRPRPKRPRYVIQQHDASTLHYDLRLEIDGVLVSWAVPKGPSTDPREKRLAIRTEDHPLAYADFEGTIPEDEYGGGTVLVWDHGTWNNRTEKDGEPVDAADALEHGHILAEIEGEKLHGGYALSRFRVEDGKEQWLLVKKDDDAADARRNPVSTQPRSVLTGDTISDVASKAEDVSDD